MQKYEIYGINKSGAKTADIVTPVEYRIRKTGEEYDPNVHTTEYSTSSSKRYKVAPISTNFTIAGAKTGYKPDVVIKFTYTSSLLEVNHLKVDSMDADENIVSTSFMKSLNNKDLKYKALCPTNDFNVSSLVCDGKQNSLSQYDSSYAYDADNRLFYVVNTNIKPLGFNVSVNGEKIYDSYKETLSFVGELNNPYKLINYFTVGTNFKDEYGRPLLSPEVRNRIYNGGTLTFDFYYKEFRILNVYYTNMYRTPINISGQPIQFSRRSAPTI